MPRLFILGWRFLKGFWHFKLTVNVSSMNKRNEERGKCMVGKKGLKEQVRAQDEDVIKRRQF